MVIALIAVLVGGLGLALRTGDRSTALQSGQATLASLLVAARGQSALTGRNAALLLHADPSDEARFLRALSVAVRNPANDEWLPSDEWILVPPGVALLPPVETAELWTGSADAWGGMRSSAFSSSTESFRGIASHVLAFTPRGTVSGGGGDIILAPIVSQPPSEAFPLRFEQPDAVRGVTVSTYGIATLIHDRSGF